MEQSNYKVNKVSVYQCSAQTRICSVRPWESVKSGHNRLYPKKSKDQIFFLDCVLVGRPDFGFGDKSGEKVSGRVASV